MHDVRTCTILYMCMPNTESVYIIYITIRWPYIILAEMHRYIGHSMPAIDMCILLVLIISTCMCIHVAYVYMQLQGGHTDISVDITN